MKHGNTKEKISIEKLQLPACEIIPATKMKNIKKYSLGWVLPQETKLKAIS